MKCVLITCILFAVVVRCVLGDGYWYYKAKGNKAPADSEEIVQRRLKVATMFQCASRCSGWSQCQEYSIKLSPNGSSSNNCIISEGNAGCKGGEEGWTTYRKYERRFDSKILEDTCEFKNRVGITAKVASLSTYKVSCDSNPKAKTFFYEIKLHESSREKIDGYGYLYVGEERILDLNSSRPKMTLARSLSAWEATCPQQTVLVEVRVNRKAELTAAACRYLMESYGVGDRLDVDMKPDPENGGMGANCPIYSKGIHVMTGFHFQGKKITHLICSLLIYK